MVRIQTERRKQYKSRWIKKWRERNPEKNQEQRRRYKNKNRKMINARTRERSHNDGGRKKDKRALWRKHNPEKDKIHRQTENRNRMIKMTRMHASINIIRQVEKSLKIVMEKEESFGAMDRRYWEQVKPRLEACRLLSQRWREDNVRIRGKDAWT